MSINLSAVGLRVKPLVFGVFNRNLERAKSAFGEYKISPSQGKRVFCDVDFHKSNSYVFLVLAKNVRIESARAACQRHHEQQVLSMLEPCEAVPSKALISEARERVMHESTTEEFLIQTAKRAPKASA